MPRVMGVARKRQGKGGLQLRPHTPLTWGAPRGTIEATTDPNLERNQGQGKGLFPPSASLLLLRSSDNGKREDSIGGPTGRLSFTLRGKQQ